MTEKIINMVDEILDHPSIPLQKANKLVNRFLDENEYQDFFRQKMKDRGISSPSELSDEEKGAFFSDVKKGWAAKKK